MTSRSTQQGDTAHPEHLHSLPGRWIHFKTDLGQGFGPKWSFFVTSAPSPPDHEALDLLTLLVLEIQVPSFKIWVGRNRTRMTREAVCAFRPSAKAVSTKQLTESVQLIDCTDLKKSVGVQSYFDGNSHHAFRLGLVQTVYP